MAYTLGNKCAKNLCKRTVLVQLIIENVVTCFLRHSIDHSRSLKMVPFERLDTVFYLHSIGTITLSRIVSEIKRDIG